MEVEQIELLSYLEMTLTAGLSLLSNNPDHPVVLLTAYRRIRVRFIRQLHRLSLIIND
jgi:hypothetical protein